MKPLLTPEVRGWARAWQYISLMYQDMLGWEYLNSEGGHLFVHRNYLGEGYRYLGIPILEGDFEAVPVNA